MKRLRRGFTLIELLIVIALILMVYTLVFSYFQKKEEQPQPLSPLTLKSSLHHSGQLQGHTTFLCIDECTSCYIRHGINDAFTQYEAALDLKDTVAYILDEYDNLSAVEYGRYDDEEICLKLDFYPNGSSTKVILKHPDGVYYLPSFFGKPQQVDSIEDAKELWQENTALVSNTGDFY